MLYRCDCEYFNINNNNYRKILRNKFCLFFCKNINFIKNQDLVILFLESGGIKDEYAILSIIKNILNKEFKKYFKNKIYIIFHEEIKNDFFIQMHNKIFYYLKRKYKDFEIEVVINNDNNFLSIIDSININIKNIFIVSIDQYNQTYLPNQNLNELKNDYIQNELKNRFNFSYQSYLYYNKDLDKAVLFEVHVKNDLFNINIMFF